MIQFKTLPACLHRGVIVGFVHDTFTMTSRSEQERSKKILANKLHYDNNDLCFKR
ncbi:MAG: hypothetical protein FJ041_06335 [Candidatus Cloacimonetes bacterium]|nr:hypothetical protein [Candidatus Cloacimonadota bacterium]